jgi:hypothetical protein
MQNAGVMSGMIVDKRRDEQIAVTVSTRSWPALSGVRGSKRFTG